MGWRRCHDREGEVREGRGTIQREERDEYAMKSPLLDAIWPLRPSSLPTPLPPPLLLLSSLSAPITFIPSLPPPPSLSLSPCLPSPLSRPLNSQRARVEGVYGDTKLMQVATVGRLCRDTAQPSRSVRVNCCWVRVRYLPAILVLSDPALDTL